MNIEEHLQDSNLSQKESGGRFVLYSLALLTFVYIGRIHELHPLLWKLHLVQISFSLSFFGIILSWPKNVIVQIISQMPGKGIIILYILAFLSIFGSIWPSTSLSHFSAIGLKVLYFFIFAMVVTSENRIVFMIKVVKMMYIILVSVSLLSQNALNERVSLTGYYDPNDFALLLAICIPFIFFKHPKQTTSQTSFISNGFLHLLGFVVIIQTGSRGGVVSFLICTLMVMRYLGMKSTIKTYTVPAIIVLVSFSYIFYSEQFSRIFGLINWVQDYNITSNQGRLALWKRGVQLLVENPLIGTGIGTYPIADGSLTPGGKWMTAHNSFLQVGVELGIPAMLLLILILKISYQKLRKISTSNLSISTAAIPVKMAIITYIAGGMFLSWGYAHILFLMLGLTASLSNLSNFKSKHDL